MQNTVIKCDSCEAEFLTADTEIKCVKIEDITVHYFACPSCGRKYPIFLEDGIQSEIKRKESIILNNILNRIAMGKSATGSQLRSIRRLKAESERHQKSLRDTYIKALTTRLNEVDFETDS